MTNFTAYHGLHQKCHVLHAFFIACLARCISTYTSILALLYIGDWRGSWNNISDS